MDELRMGDGFREASDPQLVVAIGRFRQDALAEAYRRHGGAAYGLASRILGDAALAEDVVQEVFLRLWRDPEKFDPTRGTLRAFLLAHVHGRSVDLLRAESARRARETRQAQLTADSCYDLEREVLALSVAEHVRRALGDLGVGEREAIELAYYGGHSYREVAQLLGQPEGTVKSRIRSGLARLRTALVESGARWPES